MIREDAGLGVARFCELGGIPESSWYRRCARVRGGQADKGPWPAPKRREIEAVVHWLALRYPAWGYRKIWALAVARGYQLSGVDELRLPGHVRARPGARGPLSG